MPPSRPSSPSSLPSSSPCSYSPYCASCGSSRNGLSSSLLRTTAAKASEDVCSIRTASCRRGESVWDWRMSALRCMEPISSAWCNDTKTQAPCRHAGGESSGYTLGTKPAVVSLRRRHGAQGFAAAAGDRFWNSGAGHGVHGRNCRLGARFSANFAMYQSTSFHTVPPPGAQNSVPREAARDALPEDPMSIRLRLVLLLLALLVFVLAASSWLLLRAYQSEHAAQEQAARVSSMAVARLLDKEPGTAGVDQVLAALGPLLDSGWPGFLVDSTGRALPAGPGGGRAGGGGLGAFAGPGRAGFWGGKHRPRPAGGARRGSRPACLARRFQRAAGGQPGAGCARREQCGARRRAKRRSGRRAGSFAGLAGSARCAGDRKSTRLNSSHT